MTWEETIKEIRNNPDFQNLVFETYIEEDLENNVNRFLASEEFHVTLKEITSFTSEKEKPLKILDLGAGNGIASISFALSGHTVSALEPDPSDTVGAGAIRKLSSLFNVTGKVDVVEAWGEKLPFKDNVFDVVYGRQVMHHAHSLKEFVSEASRVLKKNGVFITTRDHVIKNDSDKEAFLNRHPLHKFYGGENAFTLKEYSSAIKNAGLKIVRSLDATQTAINYSPWGKEKVKSKFSLLGRIPLLSDFILYLVKVRLNNLPGRLHTFLAIRKD